MAIVYVSWNIKQLGESKMKQTSTVFGTQSITAIAGYLLAMNADVVGVMEVTLRLFGTDAPKQILNALGPNYMVVVSSNDANNKPDRYAFFYNKNTVDFNFLGWPEFVDTNKNPVTFPNRYPAIAQFKALATNKTFGVMILHGPEPQETTGGGALQAMADLASLDVVQKPAAPLIISGDFNVDYNLNSAPYTTFENLGYKVLFKGNKTSLKMKFETKEDPGTYLKSAYDNIFLSPQISGSATGSGVYDPIQLQANLTGLPAYSNSNQNQKDAWQTILTNVRNRVSDHLPVWASLNI